MIYKKNIIPNRLPAVPKEKKSRQNCGKPCLRAHKRKYRQQKEKDTAMTDKTPYKSPTYLDSKKTASYCELSKKLSKEK
ncbi:hypothetical protein WKV44_03275 [Spirochaetia bacterium 38H-sp]|uniref:Uncharacterized protein n=1 Tax=Rarispira pelagica TaxID=3141764 RepID=A0ABU9UA78_9SPIR